MALPLLPILLGAGLVIVASSSKPGGDPNSTTIPPIPPDRLKNRASPVGTGKTNTSPEKQGGRVICDNDGSCPPGMICGPVKETSTGPRRLCIEAPGSTPKEDVSPIYAMWGGRKLSQPGELLPGYWADLNELPSSMFRGFWIKSSPAGALGLHVKDPSIAFLWHLAMPREFWPKKKSGKWVVRLPELVKLLGPSADWNRFKNSTQDIVSAVTSIISSVGAVVGTGGAAAAAGGAASAGEILDKVTSAVDSVRGSIKKALTASSVIVRETILYPEAEAIYDFNRHLLGRRQKLDFGKNYPCDPEFNTDLKPGGKCRPLIFIPSAADIQKYFPGGADSSTNRPAQSP